MTKNMLIAVARTFVGCHYSNQGRTRTNGFDCGGLVLVLGRETGLSSLEHLGYSQNPDGETFEQLLAQEVDELPAIGAKPNPWNATPGDLLAFDFGKGIQHIALITEWNGRRFTVIHATRQHGVHEAPLGWDWLRRLVKAYKVRGLS